MQPIITFQQLKKAYGNHEVLKGISLDMYPGQVIGYIGPNGAGKSTTVKILVGLITEYTGEVVVKGMRLKEHSLAIKKMIGYVPEISEMYDVLTPYEYLHFMASLYDITYNVATKRMTLMLDALSMGENMHQRIETFSKGMRQKVLLAGAIIHDPAIIVLDEPLSGLDANTVIIIKQLLVKLAQLGKTIVYCSHMMDIVEKVTDRIILINQGSVVADGSFEELQQQQGNSSLEKIFSTLTVTEVFAEAADKIIQSLCL
jgi:ABC-2 type transport system ATP-binding protein